jgi:hypothetical protein
MVATTRDVVARTLLVLSLVLAALAAAQPYRPPPQPNRVALGDVHQGGQFSIEEPCFEEDELDEELNELNEREQDDASGGEWTPVMLTVATHTQPLPVTSTLPLHNIGCTWVCPPVDNAKWTLETRLTTSYTDATISCSYPGDMTPDETGNYCVFDLVRLTFRSFEHATNNACRQPAI